MRYLERAPHPALAGVVHRLWLFESDAVDDAPQPIVPDGHPELLFHYRDAYFEIDDTGAALRQPAVVFAGQLIAPLRLRAAGRAGVVGVRLEPGAARALLGVPMHECRGRRIDAAALWPGLDGTPLDVLRDAADAPRRLALVERLLLQRMAGRPPRIDARVAHAVALLQDGRAPLTIDALAARVNCSPRQLERRFLHDVGLPPRLLASVLRFRRLFDHLDAAPRRWSDAAAAAGYFDQAHMIRDFRRFAGRAPSLFERQLDGLSAAMVGFVQDGAGAAA